MVSYTYAPLSGADEIRVLILEPSRDKTAPLRGSLKKTKLPIDNSSSFNTNGITHTTSQGGPFQDSGSSVVSSGKTQWKWEFKPTWTTLSTTWSVQFSNNDGSKYRK